MPTYRKFGLALLAAVFTVFLSRPASAQEEIRLDFSGGWAIPTSDLSDVADASPGFAMGVDFRVHEYISARVAGGANLYSGADIPASMNTTGGDITIPDLQLIHFNAGPVFHVMANQEDSPVNVDVNAGAGIHILTSDRGEFQTFPGRLTEIDLSQSYFGITGGATIGYDISPTVEVFARGEIFLTFADEADLADLALLNTDVTEISTLFEIPITGGLRFHFQP